MSKRGFDPVAQAGKVPDPERRVDVLVIGAGLSGVAAAIEAASGGAQVLLVDENPVGPGLMGLDTPLFYGGRYTGAVQNKARMVEQVFAANPGLERAFEAGVEVELGVYCWGAFVAGYGLASLPEPVAGLADEARSWMVGFKCLILATGARDVAFSFMGWDQPGVMGAQGFNALTSAYGAFAGRRVAILGSGELALRTALTALERGLEVVALVEVAQTVAGPADLAAQLAAKGVEMITGCAPVGADGGLNGLEALTIADLATGARRTLACDTLVEAIGVTPVIELLDVLGASHAMQPSLGGHAPVSPDGSATSLAEVFVAGDVVGTPGGCFGAPEVAEASGRRAARAALASLGHGAEVGPPVRPAPGPDAVALQQGWMRALTAVNSPATIICQCEDVTREALLAVRPPAYLGAPSPAQSRRDLGRLLRDGPANQDQIKRLTRACMGPCQARRCREQVAFALACGSNESAERIPLAGYRAPVRPLPLSVLAAWDESAVMSDNWDVWMGVDGQWTPYDDIGTEREALSAGILGGAA